MKHLKNSFVSRFYMSLKAGLADWSETQADGAWKHGTEEKF